MKIFKSIFSFLALACAVSLNAQTNVNLHIEHMLGSNTFAFNQTASNNLGHSFNVVRMEYYLSEITLIHDGGQDTTIDNLWILVDAGSPTTVPLGSFNISALEGIRFAVGVDSAHNHLDPASWPTGHPLAPKSPSMHWGWAAGYRFVAMEGKSGPSLNQIFEIHALGNKNYHTFSIATSGTMNGGDLDIDLKADYEGMLHDIGLNQGLVEHGENNEAAQLLENCAYHVFTASGSASIGVEEEQSIRFDIYPNPAHGQVQVMNTSGFRRGDEGD